jgi:death on curing protein
MSKNFKYISEKDILIIHALVVETTGGDSGVRDIGLIKSAVARPKMTVGGEDAFKTLFEKGAVYLDSIVRNHALIDGNKRTGITVASRFLNINGFEINVSDREMVDFVIRVATEKLEIKEIALWLEENSQKTN